MSRKVELQYHPISVHVNTNYCTAAIKLTYSPFVLSFFLSLFLSFFPLYLYLPSLSSFLHYSLPSFLLSFPRYFLPSFTPPISHPISHSFVALSNDYFDMWHQEYTSIDKTFPTEDVLYVRYEDLRNETIRVQVRCISCSI